MSVDYLRFAKAANDTGKAMSNLLSKETLAEIEAAYQYSIAPTEPWEPKSDRVDTFKNQAAHHLPALLGHICEVEAERDDVIRKLFHAAASAKESPAEDKLLVARLRMSETLRDALPDLYRQLESLPLVVKEEA